MVNAMKRGGSATELGEPTNGAETTVQASMPYRVQVQINGAAAAFVRFMSGSFSGVVGLPLFETAQMLRGFGWAVP